jgi:hypothetical protein
MILGDYYRSDPRLVLVPIEHLHPGGLSRAFAAWLEERCGWSAAACALLDHAVQLYWSRGTELARRTHSWPPPRLRHIAVVPEPLAVHPYAQLLNTSAWTLYASDFDAERSHAEFAAYLLAHGDRMALLGEVTLAALHNAVWWFERSDAERAAFASAAAATTRPDAAAWRALAEAVPWLRQLRHVVLRPSTSRRDRAIPGTELLVAPAHQTAPPGLVDAWTRVARDAVAAYTAAWRAPDRAATDGLAEWLATEAPPLLVTAGDGRVVWDPRTAGRLDALRTALASASGAAVRDVHADLVTLDRHTRRFLDSLADPAALPAAAPTAEQRGYTFMHRERRLLAYNLDEPGIDRHHGPALPFARAMLGARAVHEWAHLAVDAGWVPLAVSQDELERRVATLAQHLAAVVADAPPAVQRVTADDIAGLAAAEACPAGAALARVLLRRLPDFQSNLLAQRYLEVAERETYVRQNVRTLRGEYPPARLWRMLARYLFEYQYLRFSAVADRKTFFLRSTWFDADCIAPGTVDEAAFDRLTAAVASICDGYTVDESKFLLLLSTA